ncbi:ABC transporter permease [Mucilaginibacter sp. CSA2-8R]|uniref:ABC transporter permease n=1 Tax=Mucilaginibacter sp. CSA2-8R TaxID=3141542 RepID=UPI00315CEABC
MLYNYLIIAWRNIWRKTFISVVNIFGLSVAMALSFTIGIFVWQQYQVNAGLTNINQQYIIQSRWKDPNMRLENTTIAGLPRALKEQYPNIVANYYHWDGITVVASVRDRHFRELTSIGDSTLFNMYGFRFKYGNAKTALSNPNSVVITEGVASKFFGKTDVIGEAISLENFSGEKKLFEVSGVLKNLPQNTVTQSGNSSFGLFLPVRASNYFGRSLDGWSNFYTIGLIELKQGASLKSLNLAMSTLVKKHTGYPANQNLTPYAVPLHEYHLRGEQKMLYILCITTVFIMMMAIVNFVNISISSSSQRLKEMGIRKVLGGLKKHLMVQFLTESVVIVTLSTLLALVIYVIARPLFGAMLNAELAGIFALPIYFYFLPVLIALTVGLLAGFYPALVLSQINSISSLKGNVRQIKDKVLFRKILIAFQFSMAAIVLSSAIIISKQVNLFFGKKLGYEKDYIVYAQVPRDWSEQGVQKMEFVRSQLAAMPQISSVSLSYSIPDGNFGGSLQAYRMSDDSTRAFPSIVLPTDNYYANTYGIKMIAGEFFKPQHSSGNSAQVVINESQVKQLDFASPQAAIGQQFKAQGMPVMTICGVTQDFQFGTMHEQVKPVTFVHVLDNTTYRFLSVKLKPGNMEQALSELQNKWTELLPDAPFEYNFVDSALAKMYQTEMQMKKASYVATSFAVVIVLLGVLGLISINLQTRIKEIGIRKVMGSSVNGIIMLFMKDFLKTVVTAGLIACPVAYALMSKWLDGYAYRVNLSPFPFIVTMVTLLILTGGLISLLTFKTATVNPVKSLKEN